MVSKNAVTKIYHWGDPHPLVGGAGVGLGEGEAGWLASDED